MLPARNRHAIVGDSPGEIRAAHTPSKRTQKCPRWLPAGYLRPVTVGCTCRHLSMVRMLFFLGHVGQVFPTDLVETC